MTKDDYIRANRAALDRGLVLARHKTRKDVDGDALYKVFSPKVITGMAPFGWQPVSADEPVGVKKAEPKPEPEPQSADEPNATASALELMYENGIDPESVQGSGKDGKILKKDVENLIEKENG